MKKCPHCAEEIKDDAIKCRYCGDWLNKDEINITPTGETKQKHEFFSWKSFVAAFLIAVFLNVFLSAAAGVEPRKNVIWTTLWIYLSIEAWEYWRWKALLPYPLFVLLTVIIQAFISNLAPGVLPWSYIGVILLNIGGLISFYLLLRKEIKKQNKNNFPSLVMKKGIEESSQPLFPGSSPKSNGQPISKIKMFLIPAIILILLPLLTVSLVYYDRYKEANDLRRKAVDLVFDKNRPNYRKALEILNRSIELNPKNAKAYSLRGKIRSKLGQHQPAIEDHNKAIRLNPNISMLYVFRGDAYSDLRKYQPAIEDYNKAIHLDPNNDYAYNMRGGCYGELRNRKRACDDWRKACELGDCELIKLSNKSGYCR